MTQADADVQLDCGVSNRLATLLAQLLQVRQSALNAAYMHIAACLCLPEQSCQAN
jgi:hypothetical protein